MRTEAVNVTNRLTAVTGATGFIGGHLVKRLQEQGFRVRVLVRPRRGRNRLSVVGYPFDQAKDLVDTTERTDNHLVWGDVRDPSSVARLLEGADLVFHLAAHARAWAANPTDFEAINVGGTANLLSAARDAGVRRVVHVSTELVDGEETAYQRSKRAAERVVQDYVAAGGDAVIVRPTRVYGPGPLNPSNSVTRIIALYRRGLFRVRIEDGGARANYVYVEDVVNGLLRAAECGARGAAYLLGGDNLTVEELLDLVAEATGRRRGVVAAPKLWVKAAALACELTGRLGIEPLITRDWVDVLTKDQPRSSAQAEAELGYRPRGARDGIAATLARLEAA